MVKTLIWDIEVSPNIGLFWRAGFDLSINYDSIIQERKVICISYKWFGAPKKTRVVLRWNENKDDRLMLVQFLNVANEADELVAHFGDRFDLPWFKTRLLILGLDPTPIYKTIDTKAWASKNFYFNSNKLDYIAKVLGFGGKEKTDYSMWVQITLHDVSSKTYRKALDKMCHYCGIDVVRLDQVFGKLRVWVKPKTHAGVTDGKQKWTCPRCGSADVKKDKTRVTAAGTIQHQMRCNHDHSYFQINNATHNAFQEEKTASVRRKLQAVRLPPSKRAR